MSCRTVVPMIALLGMPGMLSAQVVINEVYCNPVGTGNDAKYEYIELYGEPGMDLTGYAVVAIFGGSNTNGNANPGPRPTAWAVGEELPIIQNAWSLDGLSLGSNGLLVLYNDGGAPTNPSAILPILPPATNRATFQSCHIAAAGALAAANIQNNGSQVYILVRKRPLHSLSGATSVYAGGYAWCRGTNPDVNFDERFDFNGVGSPVIVEMPAAIDAPAGGGVLPPPIPAPRTLEPFQMVDEVGNSNSGGRVLLREQEHRISDTPGGNPDAFTRVRFYGANPGAGWRFDTNFNLLPTRSGDEEFFYGEIITPTNPNTLMYDQPRSGGPTNPYGVRYNAFGVPDPAGIYLLDDTPRIGLHLTPGAMNDVDASGVFDNVLGIWGVNTVEFRFERGDFNFDGFVNAADDSLITARVGATLDDIGPFTENHGSPTVVINNGWKWQGRDFESIEAMRNMDKADGPGAGNADAVTAADLAAFHALRASIVCASISQQPVDMARPINSSGTFTVAANGSGPIAFTWTRDGWPLAEGATGAGSVVSGTHTATLTISQIKNEDAGQYTVLVTNLCGTVASNSVMLSIAPPTIACSPADIATAGSPDPQAGPDGFITGEDADLFTIAYNTLLTRLTDNSFIADLTDGTGAGGPDGFVTGTDADFFVIKFFIGC